MKSRPKKKGHHFPIDQFLAQNVVKTKKRRKKRSSSSLMWGMKILGGDAAELLGEIHPPQDLHPCDCCNITTYAHCSNVALLRTVTVASQCCLMFIALAQSQLRKALVLGRCLWITTTTVVDKINIYLRLFQIIVNRKANSN